MSFVGRIGLGEVWHPDSSGRVWPEQMEVDYMFCIQEIKSSLLWMEHRERTPEKEGEYITISFSNRMFEKFEMYTLTFKDFEEENDLHKED